MTYDSMIENIAYAFFEGCSTAILKGDLSKKGSYDIAIKFVKALYPNAICSFIFGSAVSGCFKQFSDINIIIVYTRRSQETRRIVFEGCPIEVHIFDRSSIILSLQSAVQTGQINTACSLVECQTITDPSGFGAELRNLAALAIKRGPIPMSDKVAQLAYCSIFTSILELASNPSEDERFATMITIQPMMMSLYFMGRNEWAKTRKWAVKDAPQFASRLNVALQESYRLGDVRKLANILQELAASRFGLRWSGADEVNYFPAYPSKSGDNGITIEKTRE